MRRGMLSICLLLAGPAGGSAASAGPGGGSAAGEVPGLNGFDLSGASVPVSEIRAGGPPRDGIPALLDPERVPAPDAPWNDEETVVGVVLGGEARAYPVAILNWHELVNDTLGGAPILVSYCPLCGTALVFDRVVGGRVRTFGVSGLLYRSDLLLYDRETQSLWSQIASTSVTGPAPGVRLSVLRSAQVSWGAWRRRHPETTVLSADTGHRRPYEQNPYAGYATSPELLFPAPIDRRYHPKMPTLGMRIPGGPARAYPALEVDRAGGVVRESFAGRSVTVRYDAVSQEFLFDAPGEVEVIEGYWFAWAAFHPGTTVFVSEPGEPRDREADPGHH